MVSEAQLGRIFEKAHDLMRNRDGLQPQEAFDELLKYLFFRECYEQPPEKLDGSAQRYLLDMTSHGKGNEVGECVRTEFSKFLESVNSWSAYLWPERDFRIENSTLAEIHALFETVTLTEVPYDIRSSALRELVQPELRRGLGIFATPDLVVRMATEIFDLLPTHLVIDPACGTGTFLIHALKQMEASKNSGGGYCKIAGVDKNPRMLMLSDLNLRHSVNVDFKRELQDALLPLAKGVTASKSSVLKADTYDFVFTNPPFGVTVNPDSFASEHLDSCRAPDGRTYRSQPAELVFIEQCLKLLKPGGVLSIILPRSVLTNRSVRMSETREILGRIGKLQAIISLPPETFVNTGTQTNTVVAILKRYYSEEEAENETRILFREILDIGYDSTGRLTHKGEVDLAIDEVKSSISTGTAVGECAFLKSVRSCNTLSQAHQLIGAGPVSARGETRLRLGDLVLDINTGRTPARAAYTDGGLFILKVANLSGQGIVWTARERNYVSKAESEKRQKIQKMMIMPGDILLTSSAHNPRYIAKKVDIVEEIPARVGGAATFVGELAMIRPDAYKLNPYKLLAYLRSPEAIKEIQRLIRGQTAHLHPSDLMELRVPKEIVRTFEKGDKYDACVSLLKEEARLQTRLAEIRSNIDSVLLADDCD